MNNEYKAIGYYSKDDNAYIVLAPDLPGCFADGVTLEEAKENLAVIIEEWKDYAKELGREIPKPLTNLETTQASVLDVAKYILEKTGPISTVMLQKLVYYCKAGALAWFQQPLFYQEFEAWSKGPVCRELFRGHRGKRVISQCDIESNHDLSTSEKKLIDDVLAVYQEEDPEWLSNLTHMELPWQAARDGIPEYASSSSPIDSNVIQDYYSQYE